MTTRDLPILAKVSVLFCFLLAGFKASTQDIDSSTVLLYKDILMTKEVDTQKKAKRKEVVTYYSNGVRLVEIKDPQDGDRLISNRKYNDEMPIGKWQVFDSSGNLFHEIDCAGLSYSFDSIPGGHYFSMMDNQPFLDFEPPKFGNGMQGWYEFLAKTVRYPHMAKEFNFQGKVFLHVRIDSQGNLTVLSITRSASPYLDQEAWRAAEKSKKWVPAKKDGVAIDSYSFIPFQFILQ